MSTKKTLFLSKRFVFGGLGLAFILIVVSSLLTFTASRKLARTWDHLESNRQLLVELESLPSTFEDLLHVARQVARRGEPEDIAELDRSLADWKRWDARRPALSAWTGPHDPLEQIGQLVAATTAELHLVADHARAGRADLARAQWQMLRDSSPERRMHRLTDTLVQSARQDIQRHTRQGEQLAITYQRTGLGFIALAIILGVLSALLLLRRLRDLETFITVCAWTKRVKHEGRWIPFDEFLEKRFQLKLSHGISDEAALSELERPQPEGAPD